MTIILFLHAASTVAMTGLIWFVQVVHYPLFPYAANGDFSSFADEHQRRTTRVVAPLMLSEAATAALLSISSPHPLAARLGGLLLVSIWLSTALIQVPLHRQLANGFDRRAARRLVSTNRWRTAAWTVRSALALQLLRAGGYG